MSVMEQSVFLMRWLAIYHWKIKTNITHLTLVEQIAVGNCEQIKFSLNGVYLSLHVGVMDRSRIKDKAMHEKTRQFFFSSLTAVS